MNPAVTGPGLGYSANAPTFGYSANAPTLGYNANNVYAGYPPLMSDGRAVSASYQPEAIVNAQIIQDNHIQSNWQYREFLQKNAATIIKNNFKEAANDCGYFDRYAEYKFNNGAPLLYMSYVDNRKPVFYEDSDLKRLYLSREQLDAMKMAPTVTNSFPAPRVR